MLVNPEEVAAAIADLATEIQAGKLSKRWDLRPIGRGRR
jgi:hypothetical protein